MTEYKALPHMWHKGTGGGPGLDIYFESWSDEKLAKYNIDTSTYDHSNVAAIPAILIDNYTQDNVKKPYLTVIHMWDEMTAHLLSSKHDPFESHNGKIGISASSELEDNLVEPTTTSSSRTITNVADNRTPTPPHKISKTRKSKEKSPPPSYDDDIDIRGAIKAIFNMNHHNKNNNNTSKRKATSMVEELTLNELFEQMDNHKKHLKFLKDNDMCSDEEQAEIVATIKNLYKIISDKTKGNNKVS